MPQPSLVLAAALALTMLASGAHASKDQDQAIEDCTAQAGFSKNMLVFKQRGHSQEEQIQQLQKALKDWPGTMTALRPVLQRVYKDDLKIKDTAPLIRETYVGCLASRRLTAGTPARSRQLGNCGLISLMTEDINVLTRKGAKSEDLETMLANDYPDTGPDLPPNISELIRQARAEHPGKSPGDAYVLQCSNALLLPANGKAPGKP